MPGRMHVAAGSRVRGCAFVGAVTGCVLLAFAPTKVGSSSQFTTFVEEADTPTANSGLDWTPAAGDHAAQGVGMDADVTDALQHVPAVGVNEWVFAETSDIPEGMHRVALEGFVAMYHGSPDAYEDGDEERGVREDMETPQPMQEDFDTVMLQLASGHLVELEAPPGKFKFHHPHVHIIA